MSRIRVADLTRYLIRGQLTSQGCLFRGRLLHRQSPARCEHISASSSSSSSSTPLHDEASTRSAVPLRKQLKDQAKARKKAGIKKKINADNQSVPGWELTVGIEIHAQLNTAHKLFSPAPNAASTQPNTNVALFDLAMPGSQPNFQPATLIPAIRAALSLNCAIQPVSRFDRKHYFHWDQPAGYQITQFYEPFAKEGYINVEARDGTALEDHEGIRVGIKQVQMEQDTAKTVAQPGDVHWLDFNRAGAPLIEIITTPCIHHPATAAAFVRKVQLLLNSVDACVSGMEAGGLRADVNVSVRRTGDPAALKLGTRVEIKNLSSFKAVEDAIIAERTRQIEVLSAGGVIEGETRGWGAGDAGTTHRLRGKEGEVDYRYMPDPDLGPVVIDSDLVEHLGRTMGMLPDEEVDDLIKNYGLSAKDAASLILLDQGGRAQYYYDVVDAMEARLGADGPLDSGDSSSHRVLASNWVLHELGRLTSERNVSGEEANLNSNNNNNNLGMTPEGRCRIDHLQLAQLLCYLRQKKITARVAKELLFALNRGDIAPGEESLTAAIDKEQLWFRELSDGEYDALAREVVDSQAKVVKEFVDCKVYPSGKLMFLVGQMMRRGPEGRVDPLPAETVMRKVVEQRARELKGQ